MDSDFGMVYFIVYYLVFRWFIVRFNIPTPGREESSESTPATTSSIPTGPAEEAAALVAALGGRSNLLDIDACTTRLRLRVASQEPVDEAALKSLGAAGVLRPSPETVQVIVGLRADEIASNMRRQSVDSSPNLLNALGGKDNIVEADSFGTRLSVKVQDVSLVTAGQFNGDGIRAIADLGEGRFQVIADQDTGTLATALQA